MVKGSVTNMGDEIRDPSPTQMGKITTFISKGFKNN